MPQKVTHPFSTPQGVKLPVIPSTLVNAYFRELDDLSPDQARAVSYQRGVSVESILVAGRCKAVVAGIAKRQGMPESLCNIRRGSVVCSVQDAGGNIVALHGSDLTWHTSPAIHFSRPNRSRSGIYLAANTLEAEAWALEHNATALGLNGCSSDAIAAALATFGNSVQVRTESWRLAA